MGENNSEITIQNQKAKIFYFESGESDSLLKCFKNEIDKNKSEFRYIPENEVFTTDDYSSIYLLKKEDTANNTINKLNGVKNISIDKFELSKYLGKYLKVNGLIDDYLESKFEKDISKIFNSKMIIENYSSWEKVMEVFVVNDHFDSLLSFSIGVIDSIHHVNNKSISTSCGNIFSMKKSLLYFFQAALTRSLALNCKQDREKFIEELIKNVEKDKNLNSFALFLQKNITEENCEKHCLTRMMDKNILSIPIDSFLERDEKNKRDTIHPDIKINFTKFSDIINYFEKSKKILNYQMTDYRYYPYIVTMSDISLFYTMKKLLQISGGDKSELKDLNKYINKQKEWYLSINYGVDYSRKDEINKLINVSHFSSNNANYSIKVGDEKKNKLSFAIANVKLSHENFDLVMKDIPNRNYRRYEDMAKLINQSIKEKADMLVMPEAFIPFEWLSTLSRTCASNQFAIVTGVEHVKINDKIFNLTAVILPYMEGTDKSAQIYFHLKKHYAPDEIRKIKGYRSNQVEGEHYELYNWKDCWFSVFCCYELASIKDRSLFQSYADVLIAVEWNPDINYYSNILESLSRDLHCYCIQVNSSNYGDSRITQPSKTENKDVIRTKGGKNITLLVEDLDIQKLRDFQFKEFELQKDETHNPLKLKPTPPDFNKKIVEWKMKGELWDKI